MVVSSFEFTIFSYVYFRVHRLRFIKFLDWVLVVGLKSLKQKGVQYEMACDCNMYSCTGIHY